MKKSNLDCWKEFKVGDLFDIHPTKNYNLINSKLFENIGDVPVVVNSSYNNGIGGYVSLKPTEKGGIITFSDTTSATAIFYQPHDFIGYSHVQGLYPKNNKWNEKSMLFFLTAFRKSAYLLGFDYVNKFTRKIANNIKVKLPVDKAGFIDFYFMEKYIICEIDKIDKYIKNIKLKKNNNVKKIDVRKWSNYKIGELFEISRPHARSQINYENGTIPFVASGNYNNGVIKKCKIKNNEILDKGNCITVSPVDGSAFYQKEDFLGRGGAGSSIIILKNKNLNEFNSLFIVSVIRKVCSKYTYNNMGNKDSIKEDIIKLPSLSDGTPAWIYMEQYIKDMINDK